MRLDKFLCDMAEGSRKEVKGLIRAKRVKVNSTTVSDPKHKVKETDSVELDDREIRYQKFVYYMLNKPAGVVSATKDDREETVIDLIDSGRKNLFPVGRLDKDTTGLLLITDDGQLAHSLLHPKKHVDKTYLVETALPVEESLVEKFKAGFEVDEKFTAKPSLLSIVSPTVCRLTIREGKFHQVKRMFEAVDNRVVSLKRERMGTLVLDPSLKEGEFRELTEKEILEIREGQNK